MRPSCRSSVYGIGAGKEDHLLKVVQLSLAELKEGTKHFSMAGVSNYTTLTLVEPKGLLYVGAREAIFALSISTMEMEEAVSRRRVWDSGSPAFQAGASVYSSGLLKEGPKLDVEQGLLSCHWFHKPVLNEILFSSDCCSICSMEPGPLKVEAPAFNPTC